MIVFKKEREGEKEGTKVRERKKEGERNRKKKKDRVSLILSGI